MQKRIFYTEGAYTVGMVLLALGTALTAHGGFGMSMVVAPAYVLHLKLSQTYDWFSFGMAEYLLQILILVLMMLLLRRIRPVYLLSIVSAVVYGFLLDGAMALAGLLPPLNVWGRLGLYSLGILICTAALSLLFNSYLPPAAYEMLVKQLSRRFGWKLTWVKTAYDLCSLALGAVLSVLSLGSIRGIGIGTVVCALIYGFLISLFSGVFARLWQFQDRWALRSMFEESEECV